MQKVRLAFYALQLMYCISKMKKKAMHDREVKNLIFGTLNNQQRPIHPQFTTQPSNKAPEQAFSDLQCRVFLIFVVPTYVMKVTEYLCSGGFFFSSDKC